MGTTDILLGGNPVLDKHPVQGGVAILPGLLHATETWLVAPLRFTYMYEVSYLWNQEHCT